MSKKPWQKKERKDAKDSGGYQMPKSGGSWWNPGDSKTERFLTDSKLTKHNRFSITLNMWEKINREALLSRRLPCLSIELGDGTQLAVLDKNDVLSFNKSLLTVPETTEKKSFGITVEMWQKVYNKTLHSKKLPCLSISFITYGLELAVLDKTDFLTITKKE